MAARPGRRAVTSSKTVGLLVVAGLLLALASVPNASGHQPLPSLQAGGGNDTNDTAVDPTSLPAQTFWAFTIAILLMIVALLVVFFLPSKKKAHAPTVPLRSDDGEE